MSRENSLIILIAILTLALAGGCASLPENVERPQSYAFTDTENTAFAKMRAEESAAHPGESGFRLLGNGLDAFVARALLAHYAERSIDVQYFLYHDDLVGRLLTDQLFKAADRGVRVRILVDDMDFAGRDLSIAIADSHPHIEVRVFNSFSREAGRTSQYVTRLGSITRRMHNKSFTVDNQVAILGGRNIGNEYFDADPDHVFADLDVLAIGPVVKEVSTAFDRYWNSELAYPALSIMDEGLVPDQIPLQRQRLNEFIEAQKDSVYLQALRNSDLAQDIREGEVHYSWGDAVIVYDQPEKILHEKDETEYHLST